MLVTALLLAAASAVGIGIVAFFATSGAYSSLIALGLAVALQKYIASYFGFFVITFSRTFTVGDRVRIGNLKGDVKAISLFHFTLDEVGEDEKLGGELTGRTIHIPNLVVLDSPVTNYSKSYSVNDKPMKCDLIFDEVRIPVTVDSDLRRACKLLRDLIVDEDKDYIQLAKISFGPSYPNFVKEAEQGPRILVHLDSQHVWLMGKFVTPYLARNEMKANIYLKFIEQSKESHAITIA